MCGIAGFFKSSNADRKSSLLEQVKRMADALTHRGPDDSGFWADPAAGIALGHRRLSILDLSELGHQPMTSASGRYTIVFNGEIYNFPVLRDRLLALGQRFRGHSDTEVLLAAAEQWGIPETLKATIGMFAFAIWDSSERMLTLARDRLGEKPLYYGWSGRTLHFGSELKALRASPEFQAEIDRDALAVFFHLGYIPSPFSIYRNVRKLPPGTFVQLATASSQSGVMPAPVPYWTLNDAALRGTSQPFAGSDTEAVNTLEQLLRQSIHRQMVADVPVGAFLSGGIDSSTVVALMQAQSSRPVRTFTIGFEEKDYNEAQYAAEVAKHLKTDHTELYVRPSEALELIPRLPHTYDEPFSDSSQIPTMLVSQLARTKVTVSLSGDGGDELFAGYPRYAFTESVWRRIGLIPPPFRSSAAGLIKRIPVPTWNRAFHWIFRFKGQAAQSGKFGDRMHKGAGLLQLSSADELYWALHSHWSDTPHLVLGARPDALNAVFRSRLISASQFLDRMCFADSVSYLPDDILVKVDRASMAVSLESRVPLLDHNLVEFAWTLPRHLKVRHSEAKWILRQVLFKHVPRNLIERPKMGFGVPIDEWLRGPLREWAEELLQVNRLKQQGFLDSDPIRRKWEEHQTGQRRWHYYLWSVLMFQAWLETQSPSAF